MSSITILAIGLAFIGGFVASGAYKKNKKTSPETGHFLEEAMRLGLAEIQISRFALENSNSINVKIYAQRMVDDYTNINQHLAEIASAREVAIPDVEKYDNIAAISAKKDTQLDNYYVNQQIGHHAEMEALFNTAKSSSDSLIRTLIAVRLAQISTHRELAEALANSCFANTIPTSSTQNPTAAVVEEPDYKI